MTTIEELIGANFAVEKDEEAITAIIKIDIKKIAVLSGLLEAFAALYGWTPTVIVDGVEVENPVKCYEKCRDIIVGFVNEIGASIINSQIDKQAAIQKKAIQESFGINS